MAGITFTKILLDILFGILVLLSFIFTIVIYTKVNTFEIHHFRYLYDNWNKNAIHYAIMNTTNLTSGCSSLGDEYKNIFSNMIYKGTVPGGKDFFDETIWLSGEGLSVYKIKPVEFKLTKYNNTIYCYKEVEQLNYYELRSHGDFGTLLGKDTVNNNISASKKISGYNNSNPYLFVSFTLSENNETCLNPLIGNNFSYIKKLDYYYKYNNCKDHTTNKSTILNISFNKFDLLSENNIIEKLNKLDDYDTEPFANINLTLLGVPYIGLNRTYGLNKDMKDDFNNFIESLENLKYYCFILLLINLYLVLMIIIEIIINFNKFYNRNIDIPSFIKPGLMFLTVLNAILSQLLYYKLRIKTEIVKTISARDALDIEYYKLLEPTFNNRETAEKLSMANLIFSILLFAKYGIVIAIKLAL